MSAPTVLLSQPKNFHNETKRLPKKLQVFSSRYFSSQLHHHLVPVGGERGILNTANNRKDKEMKHVDTAVQNYRGADKSLALPGRQQATVSVRLV